MATHMEKLDGLQPHFKKKALLIIKGMETHGWSIQVIFGSRTKAQNDALGSNASKTSKHLRGLAVDIIDTKIGYNIKYKDFGHAFCRNLEQLCKEHNAYWGGNFVRTNPKNRWDPCHFQDTRY